MSRRQPPRLRPQLECLEDRVTPSVTVTTTLDPTTPIAGQMSLREAIDMVNAGQVSDNTIILPAGTYQNMQGALNVTHSLILEGAGAASTILDGGGTDRVVLIDPAAAVNVQISGVTIRNGNASDDGGGIDLMDVPGESSTLTVQNCIITDNTGGNVDFGGGGIAANNGDINVIDSQITNNQSGFFGGGIADNNQGTGNVTITNSLLAGNTAGFGGGGIALVNVGPGKLTITGSTIQGNSVTSPTAFGGGGGIYADTNGDVNISNTTIQGNSSTFDGGGFQAQPQGQPKNIVFSNDTISGNRSTTTGNGGGIAVETASHVTLQNTTISGNSAAKSGGGVFLGNTVLTATLQDSTVSGNSAANFGGGIEDQALTLAATNSIISNNMVSNGDGGGIDDLTSAANQALTLTSVTLAGNKAEGNMGVGFGGGLYDANIGSTVTVSSSLFANNAATTFGGAIEQAEGTLTVRASQFTSNMAAVGGGALDFNAGTPLTISDSTFNNNQSRAAGGALNFDNAGGTSSLVNDTFVGNSAFNDGGAIFLGNGALALVNDTINNNTALGVGGGIADEGSGTHSFQNTIVAGDTAPAGGPDVFTNSGLSVTDNGGNFIGNLSGGTGFGTGTLTGNPQLGLLQNNGGIFAGTTGDQQIVQTEALLPDSPAIGKGVATDAPTNDERGFPRPNQPDIGAIQFQNVPLTVTVMPATPTVKVNGSDTFTIAVHNIGTNALPADNSTLAVTLSAGLAPTDLLTFNLAALAAGQSRSFLVPITATTLGTQTVTATVTSPDANPNSVIASVTITVVTPPPLTHATTTNTPVGGLTLFAIGFGPTGIDLFEIDSAGDVFAVPLSGGGPIFLNTMLHLPLAIVADGRLLALLAGTNGQDFLIDIINPFVPTVEPAVFAALMLR